jgi:hypothetical protein
MTGTGDAHADALEARATAAAPRASARQGMATGLRLDTKESDFIEDLLLGWRSWSGHGSRPAIVQML